MPKQEVMPSGSALPNKEENADTSGDKGGEKLLGKFDTPEDLAKGYTELETLLDKQGGEVGELRKQNAELAKTAEKPAEDKTNTNELSHADKERSILERIDKGDIELATGMAELMSLTREETKREMETKFTDHDQKREAQDLYDDFVEDNPLFQELKAAGKLAEVMKTNPMHDEFSAFFAIKAELDANSSFEKGQEEALKIAKGADGTRRVLNDPGNQNREAPTPKKGMSQGEQAGGMMAAMQAARA